MIDKTKTLYIEICKTYVRVMFSGSNQKYIEENYIIADQLIAIKELQEWQEQNKKVFDDNGIHCAIRIFKTL